MTRNLIFLVPFSVNYIVVHYSYRSIVNMINPLNLHRGALVFKTVYCKNKMKYKNICEFINLLLILCRHTDIIDSVRCTL